MGLPDVREGDGGVEEREEREGSYLGTHVLTVMG